jgi:hypothetical protein
MNEQRPRKSPPLRPAPKTPKEISLNASQIKSLPRKSGAEEIGSAASQGMLFPIAEKEVGGIGMGVLSDGTPYLNQRGLAALCGVQNAHIGTISAHWAEEEQKPRISNIKAILTRAGFALPHAAHIELVHAGRTHYCYPAEVCLAVLEYYAFDAGTNCQPEARDNFRLLAGSKLREMIYEKVGYDPGAQHGDKFEKWHNRIALNFQSAPKGFFHVFNESHTIIYELLKAGAKIDERFVVDISIGQHWAKHWTDNALALQFGERVTYPHRYPDDHPQSKSNPQESWCYPLAALPAFREWIQDVYIEGGKFAGYLKGKVSKGDLPAAVANKAIATIVPQRLAAPQR